MEDYESVLLVKSEVFVYRIPARTSNRGYRAADWSLGTPDWTGRMRLVNRKQECILKLEDKTSGELFAKCPIDKYPGLAIEAVTDSSRYFVLRIQDEGGRAAFIGLGFGDRSDSFDLNVALQDHFKYVKKEEEAEKEKEDGVKPALDLGFKDGQTIKINMKITKKDGQEGTNRPKPKAGGGGLGLLPPPPGGVKLAPPPPGSANTTPSPSGPSPPGSNLDLFGGSIAAAPNNSAAAAAGGGGDMWGDFASAATKPPPPSEPPSGGSSGSSWVTF